MKFLYFILNIFLVNNVIIATNQYNKTIECEVCCEITSIIENEIKISNSSIVVTEDIIKFFVIHFYLKKNKYIVMIY